MGAIGLCGRMAAVLVMTLGLAGCEQVNLAALTGGAAPSDDGASGSGDGTRLVEREVEAPQVFQIEEEALWDGRPSLGGVWVEHPDADSPERVIIRNLENAEFVIGTLYRREREKPGPRIGLSSDAALALGVLAGDPTRLSITALRKEEVPAEDDGEAEADAATGTDAGAESAATGAGQAPPAAPVQHSDLDKPYLQIGLFAVRDNAAGAAEALREAGIAPTIRGEESQGKTLYRVVVGPAATAAERADLLERIEGLGYADAYAVSG